MEICVGNRVYHKELGIGHVYSVQNESFEARFGNGRFVRLKGDDQDVSKLEKGKQTKATSVDSIGPKMEAVVAVMSDHLFRSLAEISEISGYESLTGLSAGIRALRKQGHTVEKRKIDGSVYEYRLC